jgi:hypothetical protein
MQIHARSSFNEEKEWQNRRRLLVRTAFPKGPKNGQLCIAASLATFAHKSEH